MKVCNLPYGSSSLLAPETLHWGVYTSCLCGAEGANTHTILILRTNTDSLSQKESEKLPHFQDRVRELELVGAWKTAIKIALRVIFWPLFLTQDNPHCLGTEASGDKLLAFLTGQALNQSRKLCVKVVCLSLLSFLLWKNFRHNKSREDKSKPLSHIHYN